MHVVLDIEISISDVKV